MRFTHVWFDLGLTLVYTDRAKSYQKLLTLFNINKSEEEIKRAYHVTDKLFMREYRGILGKHPDFYILWYYGVLNYQLSVEIELGMICELMAKIKNSHTSSWTSFTYSREVIIELKNSGLKVGLISNWDTSCRDVLSKNNLLELFDTVIVSAEVGYEKPAEEIFCLALEQSGADASTSIYVGDNYYDDVIGSAKVGMRCLLVNPYEKFGIEEIEYPYVIKDIRGIKQFINRTSLYQTAGSRGSTITNDDLQKTR